MVEVATTSSDRQTKVSTLVVNSLISVGMFGVVGKTFASSHTEVPGSILGFVEIGIFVQPSFPPKLTKFSILLEEVN